MNLENSTNPHAKRVVLVDLRYPYGKPKVYMNGSLYATAARLLAIGHDVEIVDFNIDTPQDPHVISLFKQADVIGVSIIGSPYIPNAIKFARMVSRSYPRATLLLGGKVIQSLSRSQFTHLFAETCAIQVASDSDLLGVLTTHDGQLPSAFTVPLRRAWQQMGDVRLRRYLETEFTLVVSQGCVYTCSFCAAEKAQKEVLVSTDNFREDLRFLLGAARRLGLNQLECYASSLDFFQNPLAIAERLHILAEVQQEWGVSLKIRCLACMGSFLRAQTVVKGLPDLIRRAGLWCVGFGVDGTDERVWRIERKTQNHLTDVTRCLDLCLQMGIRSEILMVLGFQEDTAQTLWKNVKNSFRFALRWRNVVLRPYLAKRFVPGNEGWKNSPRETMAMIERPERFYNLDFCAFGSSLTHPRRLHRWMCNAAYFTIVAIATPFGACVTSPLFPQGNGSSVARFLNRHMPFDH